MKKKSFIWTIIFSLLFTVPGFVSAEDSKTPLQMEELTIQVLPEYSYHPDDKKKDHPSLLVGYHGALKNNTEKPQKGQIEIPLPVGEKNFKIGFVGDYSTDLTEMYDIEYELNKETGIISWETSEEIGPQEIYKFVIEYYTDGIKESKGKNTFQYSFKSFTDIGLMNLIFVEPLKTESFKLDPAAESHQKNSYSMNMFVYQTQGMKPGDEKNIKVEYERAEEMTTGEIMEEMASAHAVQPVATKNEEKMSLWKIISIVGGITLAAVIILIFLLKRRTKKVPQKQSDSFESAENIKKAKLRTMLMDGSISEQEYDELMKRIGGN